MAGIKQSNGATAGNGLNLLKAALERIGRRRRSQLMIFMFQ
jgi:hypothetical protein